MTPKSLWTPRGVLALLVCLLVAGLIGTLTPQLLPSVRPIAPGSDGIARSPRLDAEIRETSWTTQIAAPIGEVYNSLEGFVVVTYWAQPHQDSAIITPTLVTRDQARYQPIERANLAYFASAAVGQAVVATVVFEVPADKLAGARIEIGVHVNNGLRPVAQTPTFDLPNPLPQAAGTPVIGPPVVEPGR